MDFLERLLSEVELEIGEVSGALERLTDIIMSSHSHPPAPPERVVYLRELFLKRLGMLRDERQVELYLGELRGEEGGAEW